MLSCFEKDIIFCPSKTVFVAENLVALFGCEYVIQIVFYMTICSIVFLLGKFIYPMLICSNGNKSLFENIVAEKSFGGQGID